MFDDHLSDSSKQKFHKLGSQYLDGSVPDFVVLEDSADATELSPGSFADPVARTFPIHTKSATFLSSLYFHGQRANAEPWSSVFDMDKVARRLDNATRYWDLTDEVSHLLTSITEKSASAERQLTDADFALIVDYRGETVKRFPVVNGASTVKSAECLYRDRVQFPYSWRRQAATAILEHAVKFSAVIPDEPRAYLCKAAGLYATDDDVSARAIALRALMFPDEARQTLRKVASVVANGIDADARFELCELLDTTDRHFKRSSLYREDMDMPEEVLFSDIPTTVKQAAADTITLTTGSTYTLADIKSAKFEPFAILDSAYTEGLSIDNHGELDMDKVAAVLPTIPRDDAQRLDKSLHAVGVLPVTEKDAGLRSNGELGDMEGWDAILADNDAKLAESSRMNFQLTHPQGVHTGTQEHKV